MQKIIQVFFIFANKDHPAKFYIQIISLLILWIFVKSDGALFVEKKLYTQNRVGTFWGLNLIFLIFSLNLLIKLSETVPD